MTNRNGISLIEVVLVALILGIVAVPFLQSFGSFSRSMHRSARHTSAVYLAQSIMEQIRHRVTVEGILDVSELAEGATTVVGGAGQVSKYFLTFENLEGSGLHDITEESDPALFRQLSHFRCEIVVTSSQDMDLDADGDGAAEQDMVEVGVTVRWDNPMGEEREATLWTLLTTYENGGSP